MGNFLKDLLLVLYAIAKDTMPRFSKGTGRFPNILALTLAILIAVVIGIICMPFLTFRICLYVVLKIVHGGSFGGFLKGMDKIFERNEAATLVNFVVIYSCKRGKIERIEMLKNYIDKVHNSTYKYSCKIEQCFGYQYFVKNQIISDDILEIVEGIEGVSMTKTMLYDYIESHCSNMNMNRVWTVTAFLEPIHWNDTNEQISSRYAMIISIRHSLGDAPSLIGTLKQFLDVECENDRKEHFHCSGKPFWPQLSFSKAHLYRNPLIVKTEGGALKLDNNSRWHIATSIELDSQLLPVIKNIKRKLNVGFTDVIMAAITSGVERYIAQRKEKLNTITTYCSVRPQNRGTENILNRTYDFKNLENRFGNIAYNIPFGGSKRSIREKILLVHKISKLIEASVDYLLVDVLFYGICSYLPTRLVDLICHRLTDGPTIGITNLVGFGKSTYCGGSIDDIFLFVPECSNIGYFFIIFTYDDRLGITVVSGRGYVHNRKELEVILENTLAYLRAAEIEILQCDINGKKNN